MKRNIKKVLSIVLALSLVISMAMPVAAQTRTSVVTRVFTLYSKSSKLYDYLSGSYRSANQPMLSMVYAEPKLSSLKTSNSSIVKISSKKGSGKNKQFAGVYLTLKKPGTAMVSYKSGKNKTTVKVTVKKYVSPFSSIKLGNASVTKKLKVNNTCNLSYAKCKNKNLKLNFKAAKGWTINAFYKPSSNAISQRIDNNKSFKVTKKSSELSMIAHNAKTGQTEECYVFFK